MIKIFIVSAFFAAIASIVFLFDFAFNLDVVSMNINNIKRKSLSFKKKQRCWSLESCSYYEGSRHVALKYLLFKCYSCREIEHAADNCLKSKRFHVQQMITSEHNVTPVTVLVMITPSIVFVNFDTGTKKV